MRLSSQLVKTEVLREEGRIWSRAAAVAVAVIGAGYADAQPNVIGETYGKAVAILQAQGYSA